MSFVLVCIGGLGETRSPERKKPEKEGEREIMACAS